MQEKTENQIDKNFFVTIGRYTKQKNHLLAIRCFAKISKLNPNLNLYIIGDGELDEGICWESLLFCSQNQPKNLTIIIDRNNQQSDGYKDDIISQRNLFDKLSGWGFELFEVDGHNSEEIFNTLKTKTNLTKVIIANTIKGKGYGLFEDNPEWHYGIISEKLLSDLKNDGKSQ